MIVRHGVGCNALTEQSGSERLAALLEAMLASSLDAVVTIDENGRVLTFNNAAEEIFGHSAAAALGRDVAELIIPPALRERHYSALARHLETGERTILNRRVELTGMRADGSEFPVELTVTRVPLEGPPTFTAYLRDITELKQAEAELQASRARVVESADRERRRIERNLHDGAQQRLVAIGLLLQRAVMEQERPPRQRELIDLAQEEAGRAIAELRELAAGIHPASLTESGLPTALRGLALRAPVEVEVDVIDERFPESVEIALYYVAAEALANVAKYARASRVELVLAADDGRVTLLVGDDGVGGADSVGGSGLAGLSDRLQAIGGNLIVTSAPGAGTTVTAVAPLS
jgi:PAS domain S-box-containing protein